MDKVLSHLRNSILHVPDRFVGTSHRCPTILAFHGGGGNAAKFQAGSLLQQTTDPAGFAVAWLNGTEGDGPQGSTDPCHPPAVSGALVWNAGNPHGTPPSCAFGSAPDPVWVLEAAQGIGAQPNVDFDRLFATGVSNGSEMVYRLMSTPLQLRAAAPVSADWQYRGYWNPTPIMHIHGMLDQREPWDGTSVWPYFLKHDGPIPHFIKDVAANNGWNGIEQPLITSGGTAPNDWVETVYPGKVETRLMALLHGGHAWSGGLPVPPAIMAAEKLGPQVNVDINAAIVAFFKNYL